MGKRFPPLLVYHYYFHTASSKDHKYNKAAGITRKEGFDKLLSQEEEEDEEEDNLGWRASVQYSLDLCSGMGMLLRQVQYKYPPILKFSCLIFVWLQHELITHSYYSIEPSKSSLLGRSKKRHFIYHITYIIQCVVQIYHHPTARR
jgi:hypothetical protein